MVRALSFGIVGCGAIGRKRARALAAGQVIACYDTDPDRARQLAGDIEGCTAARDLDEILSAPAVDAIAVATINSALAPVARAAAEAGKHVLVEKPAARSSAELRPVLAAARRSGVIVKVGFNHRFHPAFRRARELFDAGAVGELMHIRARYGHGGRLGYEREWRADPALSGGGELLDQGIHLIDLARWFAGDFVHVSGYITTAFWPMAVEDNGFAMLRTERGQVAWLHASCTEWKNLFSFEIFGRDGKLQIDGLGGSYGVERLTYYRMLPEMGPPETASWEYPGDDLSWRHELQHFQQCVAEGRQPCGSLGDAIAALEIVERLYRESGRDYHA